MATDLPDYTKKIAITVTVENEQVPETAATELPICQLGRYSGSAVADQTVATWTVTATKSGALAEISFESSSYSKSVFTVTIGGVAMITTKYVQGPTSLLFADVKLAAGTVVLVQVKSSDGTAIVVDALITGKEIG